ncbi:MAG: trypsin-like serine protease, partial [Clostridiaceae bacterium]|nr:trypsin-like serine protease [Clostridiaceae bacterium]
MTDFERFGYENYDQPKFYNETIQKPKKKKDRVWLVALVSAIIGGLLFSSVFVFFAPNIFKSTYAIYTETNQETINARKIASVEGSSEPLSIVEIAERVAPAVVGIQNKVVYNGFVTRTVNQGSGSGIIISEDGYIVTNYHVIEGASDVTVILNTGEEYKAKLVGKDSKTDIAVIKIEPDQKLTKAILGDSNSLRVGELAVAIGNPLGQQLSGTVTAGIISALDRNIKIDNKTMNLLQTDAAISPGNSGGALVNQYGEVIGINTAKIEASGAEGLGFAIPISNAKPVIEDLINY